MSEQRGPVYGVRLILEPQAIGDGLYQAMPATAELIEVRKRFVRVVAAYEVLTEKLRTAEIERDEAVRLLANWCVSVDRGPEWHNWEEAYKDARWRDCVIRRMLDEAIKQYEGET